MAQRLVIWNWGEKWKPGKDSGVTVVDLEPTALMQQHQLLAEAIGRGRIVSHAATPHDHGVLFTFIVDG
ncbi:hypothetical protein JHN55_25340 [Streptomyces sp. MBT56]|uniref:hypothetical protein n=1 Tax=unclassified Streptomyces TaxID=2593676 RepID=UPI001909EBDB|nr:MULTISPECIES: hypothetical protein [unclassified Streptomyces]MBK3559789.1 hypothetical protein [Streptomyces sp. MBT56]MBK3606116.1 hypothetical protein [Streptomyces sp. MBT54]MBK3618658.1 hypothetical protein [Streptomyces sp. MBT98]